MSAGVLEAETLVRDSVDIQAPANDKATFSGSGVRPAILTNICADFLSKNMRTTSVFVKIRQPRPQAVSRLANPGRPCPTVHDVLPPVATCNGKTTLIHYSEDLTLPVSRSCPIFEVP
jgi:hypothetical protein